MIPLGADVLRAYEETGMTALQGAWFDCNGRCCALTAVAVSKGVSLAYWDPDDAEDEHIVERIAEVLGMSVTEVCEYAEGFDGIRKDTFAAFMGDSARRLVYNGRT